MSKKNRRKQGRKNKEQAPSRDRKKETRVSWRVHPLCEHPFKGVTAVVAVLTFGGLAYLFFDDTEYALLAGIGATIFLFLMLSRFFIPTVYSLSKECIEIRNGLTVKKLPWSRFKAFRYDDTCVMLSPYESPSRLRSIRAVMLLMDKKRKAEIVGFIKKEVATDETTPAVSEQ